MIAWPVQRRVDIYQSIAVMSSQPEPKHKYSTRPFVFISVPRIIGLEDNAVIRQKMISNNMPMPNMLALSSLTLLLS